MKYVIIKPKVCYVSVTMRTLRTTSYYMINLHAIYCIMTITIAFFARHGKLPPRPQARQRSSGEAATATIRTLLDSC
jgi:hypothetical protein